MPKNQSATPVRPERAMTDDELNALVESVTPEAKIRVWYYLLSNFTIEDGTFTHDGYELTGVEIDAVCKNLSIDVEAEEEANGDSFTVEHNGQTLEYNTSCRGGVYAIEILEPGIDTIIRMEIAGMSILADMRAEIMSIGNTDLNDVDAAKLSSVCLKWLKGNK